MIASRTAHYEQRVTEILERATNAKVAIGMIGELFEQQEWLFKNAINQISTGLPRDLMITVDVHGNYAVAKRDQEGPVIFNQP